MTYPISSATSDIPCFYCQSDKIEKISYIHFKCNNCNAKGFKTTYDFSIDIYSGQIPIIKWGKNL